MFIGEYTHTVDEKKRISLPSKFRKELGSKVVVTRGLDNCLFIYPAKTWASISSEVAKRGHLERDEGYTRFTFSGASEVDIDSAGRILIQNSCGNSRGSRIRSYLPASMTESKFGMKNAGQPIAESSSRHIPVLLHETISSLDLHAGDIFVDGTLGSGGHSALVAERFGDAVEIIGMDRDADALLRSEQRLKSLTNAAYFKQGSFRNMDETLRSLGISKADAILLDLGLSSDQLEESGRGFTFQKDEPLLMTMSRESGADDLTAAKILNSWDEDALELILRGFGEEKFSRRIAREIVARRESKPFATTFDLVEAVRAATPASRYLKINPATRTFQALRIAVNEEFPALEEGLKKGFDSLNSGGRFAVISFHSLEDRIVKNFFREQAAANLGRIIIKKPIVPGEAEIRANPRSRSAKLRAIEKI